VGEVELSVAGLTKWRKQPRQAVECTSALLRDVSLRAESGALTMVTGPAGAGKSILLRCLAGLEQPDSGEIRVDGRRVDHLPVAARQMALIGRDCALWPNLSVYRNIAAGLLFRKSLDARGIRSASREDAAARTDPEGEVLRWAEATGVARLLDRYPDGLTVEEAFRVALARSLASRPRVLLLDDPVADLPNESRQETIMLVRKLLRGLRELEHEMVVLWAVRDALCALAVADEVAYLADGQLLQQGKPEAVYANPLHLAVARGFGPLPLNVLEARLTGAPPDTLLGLTVPAIGEVKVSLTLERAGELARWASGEGKGRDILLLGIRPENILVGFDPADFKEGSMVTPRMKVTGTQFQGWYRLIELRPATDLAETASFSLQTVTPATRPLRDGDECFLAWAPEDSYLFDPVSERRIQG